MNGTETDRWYSTVHIIPVVVGKCDMQLSLIFGTVAVRMSNEACLALNMVY